MWTDEQDWIYRIPSTNIEAYVFRKRKIIWLHCDPYGKNQYKKKEYNQRKSLFKEFKNNDPWHIYVK